MQLSSVFPVLCYRFFLSSVGVRAGIERKSVNTKREKRNRIETSKLSYGLKLLFNIADNRGIRYSRLAVGSKCGLLIPTLWYCNRVYVCVCACVIEGIDEKLGNVPQKFCTLKRMLTKNAPTSALTAVAEKGSSR